MGLEANLQLPPLAPFPEAAWRHHQVPEEWEAALDAWITLAEAYLSLPISIFLKQTAKIDSVSLFLKSFVQELALSRDTLPCKDTKKITKLRKLSFLLLDRFLTSIPSPEDTILRWDFLVTISSAYGIENGSKLGSRVWEKNSVFLEASLDAVKRNLIKELDSSVNSNLEDVCKELQQVSRLVRASPEASVLFMTGSDFLDSLVSCYSLSVSQELRTVIARTTYYSLIGLINDSNPKYSLLLDQIYSLKAATFNSKDSSKDSLVAELASKTDLLSKIQERMESSGAVTPRAKAVLDDLKAFEDPRRRPARKNVNKGKGKGKGIATEPDIGSEQVHIHQASLISQVQDIFPNLGSGFIAKMLDAYDDDTEQVIAHLLEQSLPAHLANANQAETLDIASHKANKFPPDIASYHSSSQLPIRRNIFDDDDFDQLTMDTSKLYFGRKNPEKTADDVLQDKSTAPTRAAILSALATFDSDDDERDDTYDTADVGGTVDAGTPGDNPDVSHEIQDARDEALFIAYKNNPEVFTRNNREPKTADLRTKLKEETGMTDEAIYGWGIMLARDSRQIRRLEAKFSHFSGQQNTLSATSWKASPAGSGTEDSDMDWNNPNHRGRGGRLRGQGRGGRGRGRGNVAGSAGERDTEAARRGKEANKGSRANHNRRDQRAKKMARGGFAG